MKKTLKFLSILLIFSLCFLSVSVQNAYSFNPAEAHQEVIEEIEEEEALEFTQKASFFAYPNILWNSHNNYFYHTPILPALRRPPKHLS